jgi:UDP:flavonoid glycosyltransferase YjiC (YdhE family)
MRILFAVLDWGLGHSSRSIPIIQFLMDEGFEVQIASSGLAGKLLQSAIPNAPYTELPAYRPKYSIKDDMVLSMMRQLPHFLQVIEKERKAINEICAHQQIDLIISDNRYGCFHPRIPSVMICHQLSIPVSGFSSVFSPAVQTWHRHLLRRFTELWIPDKKGQFSLAGRMSDSINGLNSQYIGWPSRFSGSVEDKGDRWLFLLSGPEPQRSFLEMDLLKIAVESGKPTTLVRGSEGALAAPENVKVIPFAGRDEILNEVKQSSLVFCRSGYSSIMDLIALQRPGVLIPTPGMPEQNYLAKHLSSRKMFLVQQQGKLDLEQISSWNPEIDIEYSGWDKEKVLRSIQSYSPVPSGAPD